jgi:hypothetical protein
MPTQPEEQKIFALADRFMAAIQAGDTSAIPNIYSPNAKIWFVDAFLLSMCQEITHSVVLAGAYMTADRHNNDGITQTVSENLVVLSGLVKGTKSRSYENRVVRIYSGPGTEKGFIQQHVLVAKAHDGVTEMRLPAVIICAVDEACERITKLDEYFDDEPVRKWVAGLQAAANKAKAKM